MKSSMVQPKSGSLTRLPKVNQVVRLPNSTAMWLVTSAMWGGGGCGHGPGDIYPDAWQVRFHRLNPKTLLPTTVSRTANMQTTCYSNRLESVELVGKWVPTAAKVVVGRVKP